jgi:hypothetical protein
MATCATVETSCALVGAFMAKAGSGLIPVGDERMRLMRLTEGEVDWMDGSIKFAGHASMLQWRQKYKPTQTVAD